MITSPTDIHIAQSDLSDFAGRMTKSQHSFFFVVINGYAEIDIDLRRYELSQSTAPISLQSHNSAYLLTRESGLSPGDVAISRQIGAKTLRHRATLLWPQHSRSGTNLYTKYKTITVR